MRRFMIASGNFFFRYRDLLNPVVFVALCLLTRPMFPFGEVRDTALIVIGVALLLAGQALRAAVIGFAYIRRGGKDKQIYADNLVREGFFAHCRNPIYVGNLLAAFGLLVVYGSPAALLIGGAFFLYMYVSITLAEEKFLGEKFGAEYDEYRRTVNRFVPSLVGLSKTLEGMKFDWPRLIRKEYGTTGAWIGTLIGLLAWKSYLSRGRPDWQLASQLGILAAITFVLWLTARVMKKRGLLGYG